MKSKLDKLNELAELLKSGVISKDEFDSLKNELINQTPILKKKVETNSKIHQQISKKSRNSNYVVYAFIALIFCAYFLYRNLSSDILNEETNFNDNNTYNSLSTISNEDVIESNINSHLENNSFSINGNGNVSFYLNRKRSGDRNQTGTIDIRGGRATLQGEISILSSTSILVTDLKAISGNFDASINGSSSGVFYLKSNGDLYGKLSGNRESKDVTFVLNR